MGMSSTPPVSSVQTVAQGGEKRIVPLRVVMKSTRLSVVQFAGVLEKFQWRCGRKAQKRYSSEARLSCHGRKRRYPRSRGEYHPPVKPSQIVSWPSRSSFPQSHIVRFVVAFLPFTSVRSLPHAFSLNSFPVLSSPVSPVFQARSSLI